MTESEMYTKILSIESQLPVGYWFDLSVTAENVNCTWKPDFNYENMFVAACSEAAERLSNAGYNPADYNLSF